MACLTTTVAANEVEVDGRSEGCASSNVSEIPYRLYTRVNRIRIGRKCVGSERYRRHGE